MGGESGPGGRRVGPRWAEPTLHFRGSSRLVWFMRSEIGAMTAVDPSGFAHGEAEVGLVWRRTLNVSAALGDLDLLIRGDIREFLSRPRFRPEDCHFGNIRRL